MRKLEKAFENPIDNLLIDISESMFPIFRQWDFTANDITTLSFIFTLITLALFQLNWFKASAITFLISYLFDVADGLYAREYGFLSRYGDWYDHINDLVRSGGILALMYFKVTHKLTWIYLCIGFALLTGLTFIFLGCQEQIYNKNKSMLSVFKRLCQHNPKQKIKYMRYFGCGTFILILSITVFFSKEIIPL